MAVFLPSAAAPEPGKKSKDLHHAIQKLDKVATVVASEGKDETNAEVLSQMLEHIK